jgi:hypothetical protein
MTRSNSMTCLDLMVYSDLITCFDLILLSDPGKVTT